MQYTSRGTGESLTKRACFHEVRTVEECEDLFQRELAIIFKHSSACDLSAFAYEEVQSFCTSHPETPVHLISVLDSRPVSRFAAQKTGIQHESPQVIVLRSGKVIGSASHRRVTEQHIASLIGKQA